MTFVIRFNGTQTELPPDAHSSHRAVCLLAGETLNLLDRAMIRNARIGIS